MSARLRVTLVFTAVMAVVLLGAGLFLYLRLGHELDAGIERNLEARAGTFSDRDDDAVAQVLDASRRVVQSTASSTTIATGCSAPRPAGAWWSWASRSTTGTRRSPASARCC